MKQQFFNNVSLHTQKLLDKVEELMSMDINHPQERLLWQVRFKLMEASMFIKAAEDKGQPTLFDNIPPQENPNQGRLFDDNGEPAVKPKATRNRVEKVILMNNPNVVGLVVEEEPSESVKLQTKLPSKEDVIFMAKEYSKKHGSGEAFLKVLETFGATKISEVYAKGDAAVMNLVDAIRI